MKTVGLFCILYLSLQIGVRTSSKNKISAFYENQVSKRIKVLIWGHWVSARSLRDALDHNVVACVVFWLYISLKLTSCCIILTIWATAWQNNMNKTEQYLPTGSREMTNTKQTKRLQWFMGQKLSELNLTVHILITVMDKSCKHSFVIFPPAFSKDKCE